MSLPKRFVQEGPPPTPISYQVGLLLAEVARQRREHEALRLLVEAHHRQLVDLRAKLRAPRAATYHARRASPLPVTK